MIDEVREAQLPGRRRLIIGVRLKAHTGEEEVEVCVVLERAMRTNLTDDRSRALCCHRRTHL